MTLSFVLSQKGKKKLLYDNFLYRECYRGNNIITWRCDLYQKEKCTAKVHTTSDKECGQIIEKNKIITHNHVSEKCDIEAQIVKSKIKNSAG